MTVRHERKPAKLKGLKYHEYLCDTRPVEVSQGHGRVFVEVDRIAVDSHKRNNQSHRSPIVLTHLLADLCTCLDIKVKNWKFLQHDAKQRENSEAPTTRCKTERGNSRQPIVDLACCNL